MSRLLLVDADGILYRAGFATEKTKYLVAGPGILSEQDTAKEAKEAHTEGLTHIWSRKEVEPVENALFLAKTIVTDIQDRYADWAELRLWLTPGVGNFRDTLATRAKYKGNRDAMARPTHYAAIRDYLIDKWGAAYTAGQEADDAIGIDMTTYPDSVCVSFDKDLLQLPGTHYNWVTKEESVVVKSKGTKFFYQQVLSGDPVDNVPGCAGIGPVKAAKALDECKSSAECWTKVLSVYVDVYGEKDGPVFALETARLVYVRRKAEELWKPPT